MTIDEFAEKYIRTEDAARAKKDLASMLEDARQNGWIDGHRCAEDEFAEADGA